MNMGRAWVNLAHDKDQCEYVNELSGSIKRRELSNRQLLKKDSSAWKMNW
jgi:hypothetical protein